MWLMRDHARIARIAPDRMVFLCNVLPKELSKSPTVSVIQAVEKAGARLPNSSLCAYLDVSLHSSPAVPKRFPNGSQTAVKRLAAVDGETDRENGACLDSRMNDGRVRSIAVTLDASRRNTSKRAFETSKLAVHPRVPIHRVLGTVAFSEHALSYSRLLGKRIPGIR